MRGSRLTTLLIAFLILAGLCLLSPRVLAFAEVASLEFRYLFWLVLVGALGVWVLSPAKRKK